MRATRVDRGSISVKCKTCGEILSIVSGAFDALHDFLWRHHPKRQE